MKMIGNVPPTIEAPKTLINIGKRETLLLGMGGLSAMAVFFLPFGVIPKVGLAVVVAGLAAALALGRDPKSGKNAEQYLLTVFGFLRRIKLYQRGARDLALLNRDTPVQAPAIDRRGVLAKPLALRFMLFLQILSFAFMSMLLAWIWLGGLAAFLRQFNVKF